MMEHAAGIDMRNSVVGDPEVERFARENLTRGLSTALHSMCDTAAECMRGKTCDQPQSICRTRRILYEATKRSTLLWTAEKRADLRCHAPMMHSLSHLVSLPPSITEKILQSYSKVTTGLGALQAYRATRGMILLGQHLVTLACSIMILGRAG